MPPLPRVLLVASDVEREPYPVYPVGTAAVTGTTRDALLLRSQ